MLRGWRADVLVDARLLAYRRGGIARYAAELSRWLPVAAPDLRITPFVNRPTANLSTRPLRVLTPPHHRFERWTLGAELSLRMSRLVHSVDFIAPRSIGVRHVVTIHDLAFLDHPEELAADARRYYANVGRSVAEADRVICVSDFTAHLVKQRFSIDPGKLVTIWNGADSGQPAMSKEQAVSIIADRLGHDIGRCLRSDRPMLLAVGTVEPRKRYDLLLAAMRQVSITGRTPRPLLVIVGQRGWNCDEIVEQIRGGQESGDVIWLDSVDDVLMAALYSTATIHLTASREEGFGLPMLEAMRSGAVIIAAARGALPEIAGDAAMLLSSDDPHEWALAVSRLLDNPELQADLRQRGGQRVAEFTWERSARQTADVYREVLAR